MRAFLIGFFVVWIGLAWVGAQVISSTDTVFQWTSVNSGTAALPAVRNTQNPTLGLYFPSSTTIGFTGSLYPSTTASLDLGVSGTAWRNLTISGVATAGSAVLGTTLGFTSSTATVAATATALSLTGNVLASADATYNVGAVSATRYNNAYFAGLVVGATEQIGAGVPTTSNILLRSSDTAGSLSIRLGDASDWGDLRGRNLTGVGLYLTPGSTSQPACAVGTRGLFWYIPGAAGVADQVQICGKMSSDVYVWLTLL